MKAVIFDLDNTLAKIGQGMAQNDLMLLRQLEKQGVMTAICSGIPRCTIHGVPSIMSRPLTAKEIPCQSPTGPIRHRTVLSVSWWSRRILR